MWCVGGRQQGRGFSRWWIRSDVGGQPGGQVVRALEVEQGIGQGFKLLQRQGLDLGGGGTSKWAAATVEEAE